MGKLRDAWNVLFSGDEQADPIVVDVPASDEEEQAHDTGPLPVPEPGEREPARRRMVEGRVRKPSAHFEQQRALIDSFDEDYADRWDKAKLLAAKFVALVLPVIAVLAIGDELGTYFARFAGGSGAQNLIAYAGEAALAALTYILGSMFGRSEKSASHYAKMAVTFLIWLMFILASAWGQWAVAASALLGTAGVDLKIAIWLRIGMACMLDAASVAIMFWRGKSLSKFLAQQQQKADATIRVNEAELTIERAQSQAEMRRKEDEAYVKGKEKAQEVVTNIQEIFGQAAIEHIRTMAELPEGRSRNGRQLRGGNGW